MCQKRIGEMEKAWLGDGIVWSIVLVIIWKVERREDGKFHHGFFSSLA